MGRSGSHSVVEPLVISHADQLPQLRAALLEASQVAIDTEVPVKGPGAGTLRVMSVATRSEAGAEATFVVDTRDLAARALAPVLKGITADAWNATFDARVLDEAVWRSSDTTTDLSWWDAQIGDALLHQGASGFTWYHGLAWATEHYLGEQSEGKGTTQTSYDATSDLTAAQIAYAAADALHTLRVSDAIRAELKAAGLERIASIEMAARRFLDQIERTGLCFDWQGWERELDRIKSRQSSVLDRLAQLTGGGQGNLFEETIEPSWNPASEQQVKAALNRFDADRVLAFTASTEPKARLLDDSDSVSASVLSELGGPLAEAVLEYRDHAKLLSTYGEAIKDHLHADGRLRSQYLQVVGTNTGRLASRKPNAQNFSPKMKPFFVPSASSRVFVYADLSQAELRYLAHVAEDVALRKAFAEGSDVHLRTAATMFGFDPKRLVAEDPTRLAEFRQKAKALNFGIAYGTGATSLARALTNSGTPTSSEQGRRLLDQYRATYPGTADWARARIGEIEAQAQRCGDVDWRLSLRLAHGFAQANPVRRAFRRAHHRWPSAAEVTEAINSGRRDDNIARVDQVEWVMNYSAPVLLLDGGEPFMFASRTLAGRRQQFNVHIDPVLLRAVLEAVGSRDPRLVEVRSFFEAENAVALSTAGVPHGESRLSSTFEDRARRRAYIDLLARSAGDRILADLLGRAARSRVRAMVNGWRNAPIQGGVADIMLIAYADIDTRLRNFGGAYPVQTVHDSVVVECDVGDAEAIVNEVRDALNSAFLSVCPDVVPKVDIDIRSSLATPEPPLPEP